ncbi:MAG: TIGR04283 family arsenosugar biosynthesis glycosyltransferase [Chloroflexota bacterium]|nr:TIGR04283 family arsenosugar biosynthesis glycosyltransferase [Chloroflexota bacterium]
MLVSVIIPALNEADNIQQAVSAARRCYAPDQVEIVVVDGGSSDGTPDLVPPDVALIHSPRGRAVQMNRGATVSRGDILVFCHADSQLPVGWREAVVESLSQPGVSGGTFQTLIMPQQGVSHLIRNRMRFPSNWRFMFGDQVQFMSRSTYEQVAGFQEIPLMEDVEMSRVLNGIGRLVRVPLPMRVITSSRRFAERGAIRQSLLNLYCLIRYLYFGATAEEIARVYRSSREEQLSDGI